MKTLEVYFKVKAGAMREKIYSSIEKTSGVRIIGRPGDTKIRVVYENSYPDILWYAQQKGDVSAYEVDNFSMKLDELFLLIYPISSDERSIKETIKSIQELFEKENIDIYSIITPKENHDFWVINWLSYDDCDFPEIKTYFYEE